MAKASIVFDTRRPLVNGKYPVRIRIYHKDLIYFSTNASVSKKWNDKFLSSDPRCKVKNARINNKLSQIEKEILPSLAF